MRGGLLQLHGALTVHQTSDSAWLPWRWENALEWETRLLHILCQVFVQIGWESRFVSQKQLGITEINIFNTSFLLKLVLVKQSDQVHTADIDQPLILSSFFCLHWENDNNKRHGNLSQSQCVHSPGDHWWIHPIHPTLLPTHKHRRTNNVPQTRLRQQPSEGGENLQLNYWTNQGPWLCIYVVVNDASGDRDLSCREK